MRIATTFLLFAFLAGARCGAQQYDAVRAFPNVRFGSPVDLQYPGDGSNRLFVVEQGGTIRVIENNPTVNTAPTFLDIRSRLVAGGEQGLLGLAFHPDYEENGYFYVNYTAPGPLRTVISRFQVSAGNPLAADTSSEQILLTIPQPFANHNGGQIGFGPDGYLYIATGDGGSGGDPQGNGQSKRSYLGKILRIDVNDSSDRYNYAIPPDNPFVGTTDGTLEEIYAYGLRNPWRFSFDLPTGRLWTGDVGQGAWEEVDIIESGKNYGWRIMEGFHCYNASTCDTTGLTLPVWEYAHNNTGGVSITGGYVYRGPSLPSLTGKYIYADFISGRIWALAYENATADNTLIRDTNLEIAAFGTDRDGELYFTAFNGYIYKLTQTSSVDDIEPAAYPFSLDQSWPNPVQSKAIISYSLERSGHVTLTLHDQLGREVARLVDARRDGGQHDVKLDASDLPTGSYYYRLEVDGMMVTRRVVVAR